MPLFRAKTQSQHMKPAFVCCLSLHYPPFLFQASEIVQAAEQGLPLGEKIAEVFGREQHARDRVPHITRFYPKATIPSVAFVLWTVKDMPPITVLESKNLHYAISTISSSAALPSARTAMRILPSLCNATASRIKAQLDTFRYVAVTSDLWTDAVSRSYIAATFHGINTSTGELLSFQLEVQPLKGPHTAQSIRVTLETIVEKHFPGRRVMLAAIATDGGANMVKAVTDYLGDEDSIWCLAHQLHLVVTQTLDVPEFRDVFESIREVVSKIRRSTTAREALHAAQFDSEKGLLSFRDPSQTTYAFTAGRALELVLDVPTRWSSLYEILRRFYILWPFIRQLRLADIELPTGDEIKALPHIITVLSPFAKLTKLASTETYPTLNLVLPYASTLPPLLFPNKQLRTVLTNLQHPQVASRASHRV